MPGVFFCARSGQARRRTLAQQRADAGHQVIETGIVHAQLAQRLLKRKQILGVGAERPAGPGDQRGDNLGTGIRLNTRAFTVRPSSSSSLHQVGR